MSDMRIGQGWDRHELRVNETLVLGGVECSAGMGTVAHSDGDVLVHAVVDSLLGAVGLGDIGQHFPSSSERWEDADSMEMLFEVIGELDDLGWSVVNIDSTVYCEEIRLAGERDRLESNVSQAFPNEPPVSVKFKTADGHGPVGAGDTIDASAVTLLNKSGR